MGRERLTALAWTGILLAGMLAIALRGRPASRGSRALQRAQEEAVHVRGGGDAVHIKKRGAPAHGRKLPDGHVPAFSRPAQGAEGPQLFGVIPGHRFRHVPTAFPDAVFGKTPKNIQRPGVAETPGRYGFFAQSSR